MTPKSAKKSTGLLGFPLFVLVSALTPACGLQWTGSPQWTVRDGDVTALLNFGLSLESGETISWLAWYKVGAREDRGDDSVALFTPTSRQLGATTSYEGRLDVTDDVGDLVIRNVTLADAGRYKCVVAIRGREDEPPQTTTRLLHVRGVPERPTLLTGGAAVEDFPLTLTCNTSSTSLPSDPKVTFTYSWFVNGSQMLGHSEDTLTLNVSRSDSGAYNCSAREDATLGMTSESSDVIFIDVLFPPEVVVKRTLPKSPYEVVEGHPLTLICDVITANPAVPADGYSWSYLPWTSSQSVKLTGSGRTLTLDPVTRSSRGQYSCLASNDVGRALDSLRVTVLFSPVVHIEPRPTTRGVQVVRGDFLTLSCVVTDALPPVPVDSYDWSYRPSSTDNERRLPGNESKLILGPMTRAHSGTYLCRARNDVTTRSDIPAGSASVLVDVLFSPDVYVHPPGSALSPFRVISGGSVTLTCTVRSAHPAVPVNGYSWSFRPSLSGPEVALPGSGAVLTLSHVTRSSSGQYTCRARNDADLSVVIAPAASSVFLDVAYLENITVSRDVEANVGDVISLKCDVNSHPRARMTWSVDGRPRRHVTSNSDNYVIPEAACSDNGDYSCDVRNDEVPGRNLTSTISVRVHCAPQTDGNLEASIVRAVAGDTARLSLSVVAHPPPTYKWYSPHHSRQIRHGVDSNHTFATLTLRGVAVKDAGVYVLNVSNVHGTMTHRFQVLVEEEATSSPQGQSGKEGGQGPLVSALLVLALLGWAMALLACVLLLRHRCGSVGKDFLPFRGRWSVPRASKSGKDAESSPSGCHVCDTIVLEDCSAPGSDSTVRLTDSDDSGVASTDTGTESFL